MSKGPFYFVFDLDDTIIKTEDLRNWGNATIAEISKKAVEEIFDLLRKLDAARKRGAPVKIFLLTNNSDIEGYIPRVERWLASEMAEEGGGGAGTKFFDDKLWFGAPNRDGGLKRLADVALMAKEPPSLSPTLASRTWFFDDLDTHVLKTQLPEGHYIVVNPDGGTVGIPNIEEMFPPASGGGRRRSPLARRRSRSHKRRQSKKVGRSRRRR